MTALESARGYIAGMKRGKKAADRLQYTAKPLVADFSEKARLDAAERFRADHEVTTTVAEQSVKPLGIQVHLDMSLRLEGERDAGADDHRKGPLLPSPGGGEHKRERLSICYADAAGRFDVHQEAVFKLSLDVSINERSHVSPSFGGPSVEESNT